MTSASGDRTTPGTPGANGHPLRQGRFSRPDPTLLFALVLPQLLVGLVYAAPVALGRSHWWSFFRAYFYPDQLSYAAIATSIKYSGAYLVEPFTQTGHMYYPSAYFGAIGLLARVTGVSVASVLTAAGLSAISIPVLTVGLLAWRLTGNSWAPLCAVFPLLLGTLSSVTGGDWYTKLDGHAVLWGPYGGTYTLNAEVAGDAMCIVGGCGLLLATERVASANSARTKALVAISGACIGGSANVHAYPFLLGTVILLTSVSAYGILVERDLRAAGLTAVLVSGCFLLGPTFVRHTSNLAVFPLLLVCMAPGILLLLRRYPRHVLVGAAGLAVGSMPQLALEAIGLSNHDPFLVYRQASSVALGVELLPGLRAATPLLIAAALVLAWAWRNNDLRQMSLVLGCLIGGTLMASNDAWGFNQEPYRFWLGAVILTAFLMVPGLALAGRDVMRYAACTPLERCLAAVAALVYVVAMSDVLVFWSFARFAGVLDLQGPRAVAMAKVAEPASGLVQNGPCIEPTIFKVVTGKRVPFYHLGIAWPDHRAEIDRIMRAWSRGALDAGAMRALRVRYVVTDSRCPVVWDVSQELNATEVRVEMYVDLQGPGRISLWRVGPGQL